MKFKLLFIVFILFGFKAFSQSQNTISVVFGASNTPVNIHGAIGDYGYNTKTGNTAGLLYTRRISNFLSLQTGLLYENDKVELSSIQPGPADGLETVITDGSVQAVSIPVSVKLTFFKYLFFESGFSADFQTNYKTNGAINNQSGLGGEAGIGGQLPLGPVTVFVNPYFHQYNITAARNNLYEFGVKFGLGYNF